MIWKPGDKLRNKSNIKRVVFRKYADGHPEFFFREGSGRPLNSGLYIKEPISRDTDKFHGYLDEAISKLNNSKNKDKTHWSNLSIPLLFAMMEVEVKELNVAVMSGSPENIKSECDDVINFAMFIKDNLC